MEVACLLEDLLTSIKDLSLSRHLKPHRTLNGAERVNVLRFGTSAQRIVLGLTQGDIHVGPDVTAFHPRLRNVQRAENIAQRLHVSGSDFVGTLPALGEWLRDDFYQRNRGTVVVDQRVVGTMNAGPVATHVVEFAGVLFHVSTLDLNAVHGTVSQLNVDITVVRDWV